MRKGTLHAYLISAVFGALVGLAFGVSIGRRLHRVPELESTRVDFHDLSGLRHALVQYHADEGRFPSELSKVVPEYYDPNWLDLEHPRDQVFKDRVERKNLPDIHYIYVDQNNVVLVVGDGEHLLVTR